jgi:hypothetical protein
LKRKYLSAKEIVTSPDYQWLGLTSWCLTPLSTIFQKYRGGQFIGGGNPEKTIDLS